VDQVGLLLGTESGRVGVWSPFEAGVLEILAKRPERDRLLEAFVAELGAPVPGLPEGLGYTFPEPGEVTPEGLAGIGLEDG